MKAHAILSPSSAGRWLACTPSARLEAELPDRPSEAAAEGTAAHTLAELCLTYELGRLQKAEYKKELEKLKTGGYYSEAMQEHVDQYVVFVLEKYSEAKAAYPLAEIRIEQTIPLSKWIPESYGTGDVGIITEGKLYVIDLKYGKGVPVAATDNTQMKVYALGWLEALGLLVDVHTIETTIYQPRIDNIATWEISVDDLYNWAVNVLAPGAKSAWGGTGELVPGSHCQFCKVRPQCRALADYNLELTKYEFKNPELLTDIEIADILKKYKTFINWLSAVEDFALTEAVNNGKRYPGFKLVEGRSNRIIIDADAALKRFEDASLPADAYLKPAALQTITTLEKNLGKKAFAELLDGLVQKPPGKPTLVPEEDKRPEWTRAEDVKAAFAGD